MTPTPDLAQRARAACPFAIIGVTPIPLNSNPRLALKFKDHPDDCGVCAIILAALADVERETVEACAKLVCEVCDNPDKGGEDWSATKPLAEFGGNLGHESSDTIAITECLASALYREFGFPGEAGKENEG